MQLDPAMIIFAFLALFVLWRLRSVLGERSGFENKRNDGPAPFPAAPPQPSGANDERWADFAERGSQAWTGLDDIARAQPGFAPRPFLDGASSAYEMVVQAFSRGDEAALHSLTSDEVFASFKGALEERSRSGETLETTFVGFNSVKIVEARVERGSGLIAVRFDSQFITVTHDKNGAVIEGDPTRPSNIVDVWTFARRNDASGPNWTLVATSPAQ
ncbi:Tim44/TimA family putative adaptor protein [Rhodoblastus sp.]|uniref:Tim44/TimA family putative adaptor protein n=1 Tax=Rhodoblastus sp. TaxID=1962975 RepID=UPI003F998EC4